jgi:hypothetical protein
MSRPKKKGRRKYPVRTKVPMSAKAKWAGVVFLAGGGLSMIASASLGFILLGVAGMLGWSILLKTKWPLIQRIRRLWYLRASGYVVVGIVAAGLAICTYPRGEEISQHPVTATVQDSPGGIAIGEVKGPLTINQPIRSTHEDSPSGVLTPANEADPFTKPGRVPDNALKLFLGNNMAWGNKIGTYRVLTIAGQDMISFKCTPDGLFVSAYICREDGRWVARIVDNKFTINQNNYYLREPTDRHELRILDKSSKLVLGVRYVNENAVIIQGIFFAPNHPPVIITTNTMRCGNESWNGVTFGECNNALVF